MQPNINLSFDLPLPQAEKVLAFVKSLSPSEDSLSQPLTISQAANVESGPNGSSDSSRSDEHLVSERPILSYTPSPRQELRYLLDQRMEQVVRFIVQKGGRFYNDELATDLGVDDPETSTFLGHLTRKLRKTGVNAEGFRGTNWYSKVRSSGRTLISVRADVLLTLTQALEK
jgi:hypothetical protein